MKKKRKTKSSTPQLTLSSEMLEFYIRNSYSFFFILVEHFGRDLANSMNSVLAHLEKYLIVPQTPKTNEIQENHSQYLRSDLPAHLTLKDQIDFRLLDGNLDNPYEKTPKCMEVLKQNGNEYSLFLAGHGFGKTKTIFDIAKEHYTILVDPTLLTLDMKMLQEELDDYAKHSFNKTTECKYSVIKFIFKRVLLMNILILKDVIHNPKEWLYFQLGDQYDESIVLLNNTLNETHISFSTMSVFVDNSKEKFGRLIIALDEANYWITRVIFFNIYFNKVACK